MENQKTTPTQWQFWQTLFVHPRRFFREYGDFLRQWRFRMVAYLFFVLPLCAIPVFMFVLLGDEFILMGLIYVVLASVVVFLLVLFRALIFYVRARFALARFKFRKAYDLFLYTEMLYLMPVVIFGAMALPFRLYNWAAILEGETNLNGLIFTEVGSYIIAFIFGLYSIYGAYVSVIESDKHCQKFWVQVWFLYLPILLIAGFYFLLFASALSG